MGGGSRSHAARLAPRDNVEVPPHPWEDNLVSSGQKSFHAAATPTALGQKCRSPGSIPPRTVWKSQPHWLIADWLRFVGPARGASCPSGQRRSPAAPGENRVLSPDQNPSMHYNSNSLGTKTEIPRNDTPPYVAQTQALWLLVGWSSWSQRASPVVEVPTHPWRIGSYPRNINISMHLQHQQPGNNN